MQKLQSLPLIGQRIVRVRKMTEREAESSGCLWSELPTVIELGNGTILYAQAGEYAFGTLIQSDGFFDFCVVAKQQGALV
mgnify:CR=1 FL=1